MNWLDAISLRISALSLVICGSSSLISCGYGDKPPWLSLKRSSIYSFHRFSWFSAPISILSLASFTRAHRRRYCLPAISWCFYWCFTSTGRILLEKLQPFPNQDSLALLHFLRIVLFSCLHFSLWFFLHFRRSFTRSHRSSILVFG